MIHWSRRAGIAPAIIGAAAIFTAVGFAGLQARGRELGASAAQISALAEDTRLKLAAAGAARAPGTDAATRLIVEHELDSKWGELETLTRANGGEIAEAGHDLHLAMTAFRVAADYETAERDVLVASRDLERIATMAWEEDAATRVDARRRAIVTIAIEGALLALLAVAVAREARRPRSLSQGVDAHAQDAKIAALEQRIALVNAASVDGGMIPYARRIVEAIASETGAPIVVLHVAPIAEPMALEPVAATGVRVLGRTSPPAALEVLTNQQPLTVDVPVTTDLMVHTSTVTVTATRVLLRPVLVHQRCIAVVELGVTRLPSVEELRALDSLLATVAPALSHLLADDYVHRLSNEVRTQAATVAGVTNELDNVFEAVADGLAVTDDLGRIVHLNAAGREILGLPPGAVDDAPMSLIDASNPLLQALGEGNHASGLEVALFNGPTPRIVQVKLARLSDDEASRAAVAVFRDVSRERHLEHELRAKSGQLEKHVRELELRRQELERATRLKSEFLANMSHELRTPLNAVIGFAEILLDGTFGTLNPKQTECTGDVLAGGRHLLGLINDVLDLSKIEAAKMELKPEHLDLEGVVAQAITLVRPQSSGKKISLDVDVPEGQLWVHADSDRLRQVLVNLLSNAVKFTPNGGRVIVRADTEGEMLRISVTDTGIGIAKEHADRLFKEFSQIDGSITRRFGGTGLGLAISKRLVEMQGGTIGFSSATGEGSCFYFTVPRSTRMARPTFGAPQELRRSASSLPATRAIKIPNTALVIDADDAVGRLIEGTLREAGFIAMRAETLHAARELIARHAFDVLVLDPVLPDANEAETMRFASERFGLGIVVASALTEAEAGAAEARAGLVHKPIDRTTLVEQVRAAIARRRGPRRALVVDAIEEDREAVKGLLEREGFTVDCATTIADARRMLDERRPAVLVTELDLPDGDGLELVRPLSGTAGVACVVLTARELTAEGMPELERLANVVLRKGTLSRSAFARHITAALREAGTPRTRILTVDDNEQNLRLLAVMLSKRGFDILQARDATSAVAIARAERPDLILMDVMLPDIDGLAATRELKTDVLTRAIPVIAVSANAMAGDAAKAIDAGCCGYVTKPVDAQGLLEAIDVALAAARGAALRASSRNIVAA